MSFIEKGRSEPILIADQSSSKLNHVRCNQSPSKQDALVDLDVEILAVKLPQETDNNTTNQLLAIEQ